MTEMELRNEIDAIENDKELTPQEKKMYYSIYGAEIERQRSNNTFNSLKYRMNNLRAKIINDIAAVYPELDEEKQNNGNTVMLNISLQGSVENHELFKYETGTNVEPHVNSEVQELYSSHKKLMNIIDRKYMNIDAKLGGIIDSEVFNFYKDDNQTEYKETKDLDALYMKELAKINALDIDLKAKSALRDILRDAIVMGTSKLGALGTFDDLTALYDEKQEEIKNNMGSM